jgi:ABC-type protease/lipase transport system fused ATPase/permease subunit
LSEPANQPAPCCSEKTLNWLAAAGAVLVMVLLVAALRHYTRTPDVNAARAVERRKILAEAMQKAAEETASFAVIDQAKGVYRLPVDAAVELTLRGAKDPAAARKDLLARAEKAFFVPPPPPEKPSDFE